MIVLSKTQIDDIEHTISRLILLVRKEFNVKEADPQTEPISGSTWIAFHIGSDYYMAARESLCSGHLLSGTSLVRTGLEIIIDMFYIHDNKPKEAKQLKYATAYVNSINVFRRAMYLAGKQHKKGKFNPGSLRYINPWTNASINDRIKASGPIISNLYDMLSYSNHANPGMVIYFQNDHLRIGQINLVRTANLLNAIFLMKFSINHSGIRSVTHQELDSLGKQMGFKTPSV